MQEDIRWINFEDICRIEPEDTEDKREGGPRTIDVGKEAAIEAEVQAARQRAVVPLEIRMKQFRDMLAEKEVSVGRVCVHTQTLYRSIHV